MQIMPSPHQFRLGRGQLGSVREVEHRARGLIFTQKHLGIESWEGFQPKHRAQQATHNVVHALPVCARAIQRVEKDQSFPIARALHQT